MRVLERVVSQVRHAAAEGCDGHRFHRGMTKMADIDPRSTAILSLLEFPRRLVRGSVEWETCPHAGNFAARDPRCQHCAFEAECEWLYHSDECSALRQKSRAELLDTLAFAQSYVDACVTRAGHRSQSCRCDACRWLRRVERRRLLGD